MFDKYRRATFLAPEQECECSAEVFHALFVFGSAFVEKMLEIVYYA